MAIDPRVAICTGAAQGIGRAEAVALAARGCSLVLNDVDEGLLDDAVATLRSGGSKVVAVPGDIRDPRTADKIVDAALSEYGRLDILINNAGVVRDKMIFNLSNDEWDLAVDTSLTGTFYLTRRAAQHWRGIAKDGGPVDACIINTTSRAGLFANPGQANYGSAKAAIAALTQIVARELKKYGVRCNAIAPRAYTASMQKSFGEFGAEAAEEWSPTHVANFVAYLCSADAVDITGQIFYVHGGTIALARPWTFSDPADFDSTWSDAEMSKAVDSLFGSDSRTISEYRIGDEYTAITSGAAADS